jgi:uncharacterized membrane protein
MNDKVKKIIRKSIIVIMLLGMALFTKGQHPIHTEKPIYQDFGTWSLDVGNDKVAIHAYATIELIEKEVTNSYAQKEMMPTLVQRYELYLISESIYDGEATSTWIYGARVFINGDEVTKKQFPEGFILSVGTEPTLVYWYETPPVEGLAIYISWNNAVYETRIRK